MIVLSEVATGAAALAVLASGAVHLVVKTARRADRGATRSICAEEAADLRVMGDMLVRWG